MSAVTDLYYLNKQSEHQQHFAKYILFFPHVITMTTNHLVFKLKKA